MSKRRITKTEFDAYLYLMQCIFPEKSSAKRILVIKNEISKHYVPRYFDNPSFRKTVDRNWNLVSNIRAGSKVKENYLPKVFTVEIFISYFLGKGKKQSLFEFSKNNKENIKEYSLKNTLLESQLSQIFPLIPEKIQCIEQRITKIEEFIEVHTQILNNEFDKGNHSKLSDIYDSYGKNVISAKFLEFLQLELKDTVKQCKRAKYLYKNLGNLGLFLIPLKYTSSIEETIMNDFYDDLEDFDSNDFIDII